MRRLPIYFLIDISESMVGEPIEQVQEGIATIIKDLKRDPFALETVWISIIGFAGKSKIIVPLEDVITFYPPKIPIGSGTSLSSGLNTLMDAITSDVHKTTFEKKGDWKPIVFLFTDGVPTEKPDQAIDRWNQAYKQSANLIAISIGNNTDVSLLGRLTEDVLQFNNTDTDAYQKFFKWISDSIKATSERVNLGQNEGLELSDSSSEVVQKIDLKKQYTIPDENFVILKGKCSETKKDYLVKFQRVLEDSDIAGFKRRVFKAQGAFKIDALSYNELSEKTEQTHKVSSEELMGNPNCPYCTNQISLAHCSCGGIHCLSGPGAQTCPWCGIESSYGIGKEGFDINRTLG
jgi:uncharacterized protein YegL